MDIRSLYFYTWIQTDNGSALLKPDVYQSRLIHRASNERIKQEFSDEIDEIK